MKYMLTWNERSFWIALAAQNSAWHNGGIAYKAVEAAINAV